LVVSLAFHDFVLDDLLLLLRLFSLFSFFESLKNVKEVIKNQGTDKLQEHIDVANDELEFAVDKQKEFPEDEMLEAQVENATAVVVSIDKALNTVQKDNSTAVETTEKIKKIKEKTEEKVVYNQIKRDAKEIVDREDDDELEMYYETV
jgi:hypothetical protein